MKKVTNLIITPRESKGGRAILDWSQDFLAGKVRVTKSAISEFERNKTIPLLKTQEDIILAFKEAGVSFEENETHLKFILKKDKSSESKIDGKKD